MGSAGGGSGFLRRQRAPPAAPRIQGDKWTLSPAGRNRTRDVVVFVSLRAQLCALDPGGARVPRASDLAWCPGASRFTSLNLNFQVSKAGIMRVPTPGVPARI